MRLDRERVREASPLEQVIPELTGESLHLGAGGEPRFPCSFHGDGVDKHPSGRISASRQLWYCDVCASGGDVFAFVMRHRGYVFKDALAFLAERAGTNRSHR